MDQDRLRAILGGERIDAGALGRFFAEDVHLRVGSAAPAVGKRRALAELALLLDRVAAVGGVFHEVWQVDDTCFVETEITYAGPGGRTTVIPCVVIVRPHTGLVQDIRFYLDPTPLPALCPR